jgi:hypothetical protein
VPSVPPACLVVPKRIVGAASLEIPGCAEDLVVYQPPDLPHSLDLPRRCALLDRGGLAVVQDEVIEASEVPGRMHEPLEAANEPLEAANGPLEAADEPLEAADEPVEAAHEPVEAAHEPVEAATTAGRLASAGVLQAGRDAVHGEQQQPFQPLPLLVLRPGPGPGLGPRLGPRLGPDPGLGPVRGI